MQQKHTAAENSEQRMADLCTAAIVAYQQLGD
jgi:hypothetical protein